MYRLMCSIIGVVTAAYGVAYTAAPGFVSGLYLPETNAQAILLGRYFGLALLGLGITVWMLRDVRDVVARNAVRVGTGLSSVIGLATSVYFTLNGTMTAFGWSAAIIYAAVLIGWLVVGSLDEGVEST